MTHRVLGIDPGSRKLGYGVIGAEPCGALSTFVYGVLSFPGRLHFHDRLMRIHTDVIELIEDYEPDAFAIERAFVGESAQSSMKLGEARAAAILAACRLGVPVFEVTPAEAKKAVAGNGRASKDMVRGVVASTLELPGSMALDASDALSIGLCYLYRREDVARVPARRKRGRRWTLEDVAAGDLDALDADGPIEFGPA